MFKTMEEARTASEQAWRRILSQEGLLSNDAEAAMQALLDAFYVEREPIQHKVRASCPIEDDPQFQQHTDGPWVLKYAVEDDVSVLRVQAGHPTYRVLAKFDGDGLGWDAQDLANARLLKAAPDLLRAVILVEKALRDGVIKFTVKRWSDSDPYHPANVAMTEALAKVGGYDE